jgi:hypothetical protein
MSAVLNVSLNKNGQIKIQQMSFMLVAVFFFFILVMLFYLVISINNIQKSSSQLEIDKAIGLVSKIASTPEFNFNNLPNSIDEDKIMILRNDMKYADYWGVNGIIIQKLYPKSNNTECTNKNYPDCSIIKLFTEINSTSISGFVSLCKKQSEAGHSYDRCELARIMIQPTVKNDN